MPKLMSYLLEITLSFFSSSTKKNTRIPLEFKYLTLDGIAENMLGCGKSIFCSYIKCVNNFQSDARTIDNLAHRANICIRFSALFKKEHRRI